MIVDESNGRSERNFSAILNSGKLSDRLCNVTFLVNAEGFPENEHWVLTLSKLVVTELSD